MRKKSNFTAEEATEAVSAIEKVLFNPTDAQRKAKAALHIALEDNPMHSISSITPTLAAKLTSEPRFKVWMKEEDFRDWLANTSEFRQRVEFLAHKALVALESVLDNEDPKAAGAKVSAAKTIFEISNKKTKVEAPRFMDRAINEMTPAQLEAFIERKSSELLGEAIDAETVENKNN